MFDDHHDRTSVWTIPGHVATHYTQNAYHNNSGEWLFPFSKPFSTECIEIVFFVLLWHFCQFPDSPHPILPWINYLSIFGCDSRSPVGSKNQFYSYIQVHIIGNIIVKVMSSIQVWRLKSDCTLSPWKCVNQTQSSQVGQLYVSLRWPLNSSVVSMEPWFTPVSSVFFLLV